MYICIIAAGPAGLMASLCSTTFGLKVLHVDERETITKAGRADGLQPRTLEVHLLLRTTSWDRFKDPRGTDCDDLCCSHQTTQILRNIGAINPKTSENMAFEHGKNTLFAGTGLAKSMINQGVRVYEVAFWVSQVLACPLKSASFAT